MKIALVAPEKESGQIHLASANVFQIPQGGLQQLRRLTPTEHDVQVFENANEGTVAELAKFDLVAITATTQMVPPGYKIALGVKDKNPAAAVVMGGVHVSFNPEEAASYCDCVVVGEADEVWGQIVIDFSQGRLEKFYYPQQPRSLDFLTYRRTEPHVPGILGRILGRRFAYVQATRGCPHACEFCSVSSFNGRQVRTKSVSLLIKEVREAVSRGANYIVFLDDNIVARQQYALELFEELKKLRIRWLSQTDVGIADEGILGPACDSGMIGAFIGVESLFEDALRDGVSIFKLNRVKAGAYERAIRELNARGVIILGSFIFGFDKDTPERWGKTVDWAMDNRLGLAEFTVLTPFPGTNLFREMETQGRILNKDWSKYDAYHCVFRPPEGAEWDGPLLEKAVVDAYRRFYSLGSILKRTNLRSPLEVVLYVLQNNLQFRGFGA